MGKELNALRSICGKDITASTANANGADEGVELRVFHKCAEALCRSYVILKARYSLSERDMAELSSRINNLPDSVEKRLVESLAEEKKAQMDEDCWLLFLFDTAFVTLDVNEKNVIQQLYVEGKKWADVRGLDGMIMSVFQISKFRKSSMKKIATVIQRMIPPTPST